MNNNNLEYITLAGGCFWCTEAVYRQINGIESIEPGYSGGHTANPTYEQVCTGSTGHAEAIRIAFDTTKISLGDIFEIFFKTHDPTTLNRQGGDIGTQYRSAVFYHNDEQKQAAEKYISILEQEHVYDSKIVTEITKAGEFYKAENYHENYYKNNPNQGYCRVVINPKVEKVRKLFKEKIITD